MPEFFLELFSEEIPARMQARAAEDLSNLVESSLTLLKPTGIKKIDGPRRIALVATVLAGVAESRTNERGPRRTAPEQALAGFLRKHNATKDDLREEGDFWVLDRVVGGVDAASLIAAAMPPLLRGFPWPKSMRWGGTSTFTWVRPLRRILCILDGKVVPFDLRDGADDGHGLASDNITEGHRFLSPGAFAVTSFQDWKEKLHKAHVIVDDHPNYDESTKIIRDGITALAKAKDLTVVDDYGLLTEVSGLVEWPVPLLGLIDDQYMDLPAEVMQVSMRVNQRYFALRNPDGTAAPWFGFVANIVASDGGGTIIAGNERVLRARFSDARHFWDLDRTHTLASRVAALDGVTFHAKLGSQGARVRRMVALAEFIAPLVGADVAQAGRAALLAKADLTTGMVGEFPELQGVMGAYYARHDGEPAAVADAIREHYAPKGPTDDVPTHPVSIAVALADKLDVLAGFFAIGEKPTGSGDPYALRRAALGVIRIICGNWREGGLRLHLGELLTRAATALPGTLDLPEILGFLNERLRVQLRAQGERHDVLNAVMGSGMDDDFTRLLTRTDSVAAMLNTSHGTNLLAAYRRAANILRIEEKRDGPHDGPVDAALLEQPEESALSQALDAAEPAVIATLEREQFDEAMSILATLRPKLDAFFDKVTVNDTRPAVRHNRLRLLSRVRTAMNRAADFSKIEG